MADKEMMKFIAILVVAYLIFGQGKTTEQGTGTTTTTTTNGNPVIPAVTQCTYAPTVQLGANDKYTSGQTNWGNWKYILNGGTSTTDSDGSFEVAKGDTLKVLVADANSTVYYRALWEMTINKCGTQPIAYNEVAKVGSYAVKCFNDENNPMNQSTYANNYTVGTGGAIAARCELTTTAKTAVPYGALVILEFNSTTYKENDVSVQWNGASATPIVTPGAYKLSLATGTSKSFEIPAFGGATSLVIPFYVTVQSETDKDPGANGAATIISYGDGIAGYIIPKNCYEEEDVTPSEFRCGYEDIDGTFMSPGGTAKADAVIAPFAITVQ